MTIKEVEERTGLARSNIRFYEKEKLIAPSRKEKNGYRDYSERDVETLGKIAYLRTLEISVEEIRRMMSGSVSLTDVLEKQTEILRERAEGLNRAKAMCERMLASGAVSFEEMRVEEYVTDPQTYWNDNKSVFRVDTVGFLFAWGGRVPWMMITVLCLAVGFVSYAKLPPEIPVQWWNGSAVSFADKRFIFAYPLACVLIRLFLRPVLRVKLTRNGFYGEWITEYLTNSLCFLALSVELFSVLFVCGAVKHIEIVLIIDTVVLAGILAAGMRKMGRIP